MANAQQVGQAVAAIVAAGGAAAFAADAPPTWDLYADTWAATDGLGRRLPAFEDVGPPKPDKTVAMFYYLWLDGREGVARDMGQQLHEQPDFRAPIGQWWWWGEPVLGHYLQTDPFVNRVHASELADAGVDALFFDSTNGYIHEEQYFALCKEYAAIRALGQATPAVAHVTNHDPGKTVQALYDAFYAKHQYADLWFKWQGKPMVLTDPDKLTPTLGRFFTVRRSWAWHNPSGWFGDGRDKWPWIDTYPQQFGWHDDARAPEQISVSAAQHPSSKIGRSYTYAAKYEPAPAERQPGLGLYFAEQWKQAQKISPSLIFVTNFNEWVAKSYADDHPGGKPRHFIDHDLTKGEGFFVDEYDPEFSRDIEPAMPTAANRGVDDNFYYQLVANIRQYKGVRPLPAVRPVSVAIDGHFDDWKNAAPEFRDAIGDPVDRDFDGYAKGERYVNHSGRNDIVAAHVSYDAKTIYFHVRTRGPLSPHTDPNWMTLYLDVDQDAATGWLGYDFVVNRSGVGNAVTTLERNVGGKDQWTPVSTTIAYAASGSNLELAIPRAAFGPLAGTKGIDFKWADNTHVRGDWTDFTLNGDAAPNGRFNYRAKLTAAR